MDEWFKKYVDPDVDGTRERVSGDGQINRAGIYSRGKKIIVNWDIDCIMMCNSDINKIM